METFDIDSLTRNASPRIDDKWLVDAVAREYYQFQTDGDDGRRRMILAVLTWQSCCRDQINYAPRHSRFFFNHSVPTILCLFTPSGTGKTHLGRAIIRRMVQQYRFSGAMIPWGELTEGNIGSDAIQKPNVLVVDGIGVDSDSDAAVGYHAGKLGDLWDARERSKKATVFLGRRDPRIWEHSVRREFFADRFKDWSVFGYFGDAKPRARKG